MLIPFYSTQKSQRLSGPDRDEADKAFRAARRNAKGAASAIISLGPAMEKEVSTELPVISERMREILSSEAPNRVHKSYSWLMLATLKV